MPDCLSRELITVVHPVQPLQTDEQLLFLEMWEAHAVAVSIEVVGLDTDGVDQLEAGILSGLGGQVKSGQ